MANKKISDLIAATSVTAGDLLPLVDTNGTYTTKHATFQQVLDYVADTGFSDITASYVSGTQATFTTLSGALEWSYVKNAPSFLQSNQTITLSGDATGTGTTSISVSDITASYVDWSNIANKPIIGTGDVSSGIENTFTQNNIFTTITASSIDVDTITAREYYTEVVTASVIYQSGSTKFGNTSDDIHQFTGSIFIDGDISGTNASFSTVTASQELKVGDARIKSNNSNINVGSAHAVVNYGIYNVGFGFGSHTNNAGGNVNTSIGSNALRENQTGNGNVAVGSDSLRSNISGSGNVGIGYRTGKDLVSGSNNIFIGNDSGLGETNLENTVIVTTDREVARIDSTGQLSASSFVGDGSNLTNLTASQISNFTNDVIGQFIAGDNIIINGAEISASLSSAGDVFLASDNTFTAVNTFDTHYLTASVGITGTNASFSTITASSEVKVGAIKINGDLGNVAIGSDTHISNIAGQRNVAIGSNALENNTTNSNIGIGAWALRYNITGRGNVALGDGALRDSVDSWNNVAVGSAALFNLSGSNSETTQNTAIGANSLYASVTGSKNTAVGYNSLVSNVYGSNNVAIGHSAGSDVVTGSNNIFIGFDAASGETSLENTVIIRTNQDVMRIDDAGQLSASSFVGDGSSLTNLTASQISNFTSDVRSQFTAGTNVTIVNGEISSIAESGGDVLSGSDNTFTAVNTFNNHYITASVGVSGSSAIFDSITSSLFYNPQPTYFDSGVTNSSTNFTFRGTSSTTGRLLSALKNTSEVFYVRHDGIVYASGQLTVANELNLSRATVDGQSTGIWRTSGKPAHFVASGTSTIPAVRVGTKNNSDSEKIFAVSKDLYDPNASSEVPVDVFEVLGDGTITLSGSSTMITTSGSSDLELSPGGTGAIRFNEQYKFPTADGTSGQVLTTDGLGNLTFQTPSGTGDVLTSGNNTLTGINTFSTHYITASEGITGADAKFTSLSGNLNWSYIVGEPSFLTANEPITISGDATGTGTTSISISNVTASYVEWTNVANAPTVATLDTAQTVTAQNIFLDNTNEFTGSFIGNGSKLTDIPNSALVNSSIRINGSDIQLGGTGSITVGTGDVLSGSDNTFTAVNTFNTHYITASQGITGSDAKFTTLSGNLDWSYIVNEPSFLTTNQEITLSGDVTGTGTTSISVSNVTASYVDWSNVNNAPTFLTTNQTITLSGDATGTGTTSISVSNITASYVDWADIANKPAVGTGDVLSSGNNTFTGINTFNTNYVTASAGITGSDAKFTTLSGNLDWSYIVNEPTTLTDYGITDAVTTNTQQSISSEKSFTSQNNQFTGSLATSTIKEITGGSGIVMSGSLEISGSLIADVEIPATITSTSYTVDSSDRGKTLLFSNSSTQGITCSSGLNVGFNCTFVQMGDGQLSISGSSGVTLLNRQAHSASAGRYAAVSLICVEANQYLIAGDTQ